MLKKFFQDKVNLYYVGYAIVIARCTFVMSNFPQTDLASIAIIGVGLALMVLKMILCDLREFIPKQFVLIGLGGVCFLLSTWFSRDYTIAIWYVCMMAGRKVKMERVLKIHGVVMLAVTASVLVAYYNGLIPDSTVYSTRGIRHSMGFNNVNGLMLQAFTISTVLFFVFRNNLKLWHFFVSGAITAWCYQQTHSRTGMLITVVLWCVMALHALISWGANKLPRLSQAWNITIQKVGPYAMIACLAVTVGMCFGYNPENEMWVKLNDFFSKRWVLGNAIVTSYPLTLFGQLGNINLMNGYTFLDIFYVRYAIYGVVTFAIAISLFVYMQISKKDTVLTLICICISVCMISEYTFFTIALTPIPLGVMMAIEEKKKNDLAEG